MSNSPHLNLPYLAPAQAQKHVTVNAGLAALDALVQCAVIDMHRNEPPAGAKNGDCYLVGTAPGGDWEGRPGQLALWRDGGWVFHAPRPGWRIFNLADDTLHVCKSDGGWAAVSGAPAAATPISAVQNATLFGLGTTADAANPFSAKLNTALWTARATSEGGSGDLLYTMNKESAARDLGYVFQSGYVTRALIGLFGSDRLRIAVSGDGNSFLDGLSVDNATGVVDQPNLPRFKGYTNYDNQVGDNWTRIAINRAEYNDQGAFDPATSRFVAPVAGTYLFGASLLYKLHTGTSARMRGRLVLNGSTEIRGSLGEISGAHVTLLTAIWLQTLVPLAKGNTVELQGAFRAADGYFAAEGTTFWGCKIG